MDIHAIQGEEECLPCLCGCKTAVGQDDEDEVKSKLNQLKQDADDMCMICYTENLSCAPCIQVSVILIYISSKVLLQEDRKNKPPSKTLLERYYSKRNNFKGKLVCPVDVS